MILVIDVGNSNIVFALMRGEEVVHSWRHETHAPLSEDTFSQGFKTAGIAPKAIQGGMLGCVVPKVTPVLQDIFKAYTGKDLRVATGIGADAGIKFKIDVPGGIGADRILNILAGLHYYGAPLLVIDFGTATTYDVVDQDGAFIGGAIGAGIGISLKALHEETALLPLIDFGEPPNVIGTNAVDAMQSASFFGALGAIDEMVKRVKAEVGGEVKTIATGGFSSHFKGKTSAIDVIRPDLTLQGLRLLFKRNSNA